MNKSNCAPENSARQVTTSKSQLEATVTEFHTQTDSRISRRKMLSGALAAAAAATIGPTLPVWSQTVRMQTYHGQTTSPNAMSSSHPLRSKPR